MSGLKYDRTSVTDTELLGHPCTLTSDDKQEQSRSIILDDRRSAVRSIAERFSISQISVHIIVNGIFGHLKVCARWVQKFLAEKHKRDNFDISSPF
jgi:hypothetical protein